MPRTQRIMKVFLETQTPNADGLYATGAHLSLMPLNTFTVMVNGQTEIFTTRRALRGQDAKQKFSNALADMADFAKLTYRDFCYRFDLDGYKGQGRAEWCEAGSWDIRGRRLLGADYQAFLCGMSGQEFMAAQAEHIFA